MDGITTPSELQLNGINERERKCAYYGVGVLSALSPQSQDAYPTITIVEHRTQKSASLDKEEQRFGRNMETGDRAIASSSYCGARSSRQSQACPGTLRLYSGNFSGQVLLCYDN